MENKSVEEDRPGNDCEVCGYRVVRRIRCKECESLTCGYCLGTYHCPNTTDDLPEGA